MRLLLCILLVVNINCFAAENPLKVRIAVPHLLLKIFTSHTKEISCQDIDFNSLDLGPARGLVDILLLCKVLIAAPSKFDIEYIPTYTYQRSLRMLDNGEADIAAETVWYEEDTKQYVLFSEAVIPKGTFTKGIYTLPGHPLQKILNVEDEIKNYSAVAREHWTLDWQKLRTITPHVTNASSYQAIFKMLAAGRADFTLLEFGSAPDLSVTIEGVYMVPVQNIKILLPLSRHFAVSRKSKLADLLIKSLNTGIAHLNQKGVIKQGHASIGFYKPEVEDWFNL